MGLVLLTLAFTVKTALLAPLEPAAIRRGDLGAVHFWSDPSWVSRDNPTRFGGQYFPVRGRPYGEILPSKPVGH